MNAGRLNSHDWPAALAIGALCLLVGLILLFDLFGVLLMKRAIAMAGLLAAVAALAGCQTPASAHRPPPAPAPTDICNSYYLPLNLVSECPKPEKPAEPKAPK